MTSDADLTVGSVGSVGNLVRAVLKYVANGTIWNVVADHVFRGTWANVANTVVIDMLTTVCVGVSAVV